MPIAVLEASSPFEIRGKAHELRPFLVFLSITAVICSIIRIIVEAVVYAGKLADGHDSFAEFGHFWILITCVLHVLLLGGNGLYIFKSEVCPVENRVAFFLQLAVGTVVINYAASNEGWGEAYWLLVLPPLAVIMDIPIVVTLGWSIFAAVFQSLLLIDRQYTFNYRQFEESKESVPQSMSFAVAMMISFLVSKGFADALKREQQLRDSDETTLVQAVEMLTDMNMPSAQKLILDGLEKKPRDPLLLSLDALRSNLALYRPYLPYALLSGEQFDDDEDSDDETQSEGDSKSSQGMANEDLDQVNKIFKRRRGTLVHVYNSALPNEAKEASDTSAKFTESVLARVTDFQGVVDHLAPNSIIISFNCHAPCVLHEQQACRCALAIAADLQQHRSMRWCIALASGYNLVGSCGSSTHRARVVCGENLDLVLRLPPLAVGRLNSRIIISEELARSGSIDAVPVDIVAPDWYQEGRSREITLYELRAAKREDEAKPLVTAYANAFSALRQGELESAILMWKNYCERMPNDYQAARLYKICLSFKEKTQALPHPFVRRESHWEQFEDTAEAPKSDVQPVALVAERGAAGADVKRVREILESKKQLEEKDEGFFTMFVTEDDEDDAPEALEGQVPKKFSDAFENEWQRSDQTIGFGAFSTVFLALGADGILVAMKCFSMAAKKSSMDELEAEVKTLSALRNDYIVGYVSCAGTAHHFIILMEYVSGGSLAQLVHQFGKLPLPAVRRYMKDICLGIRYLHSHGITHCDMKPHNVLLSNDGMCKLSDFGSAMNKNVERGESEGEETIVRGTSWYMSPEAARGDIRNANDIWSIGATLIEMIGGKHPWVGKWKGSEAQFIAQLGKDETMIPEIPPEFPPDAADFCRACFVRDPEQRPTAQQLLMKPFLM